MKIKYLILSIVFIGYSIILPSEKDEKHLQETPSLKITQLRPELQQIVIDYMGYDNWKLSKVLSGHTYRVNTVNICAAKSIVASGSNDETVKIWDIKTGNCIHTINLAGKVDYVYISRDGKLVVILFSKRFISVYDLEQNVFIRENLDLNPDYELRTEEFLKHEIPKEVIDNLLPEKINELKKDIFEKIPKLLSHCSISPNNQFLVYFSMLPIVKLWDLKTNKCLFSFYSQKDFSNVLEKDSIVSFINNFIKLDEWDTVLGNSYRGSAHELNSKSIRLRVGLTDDSRQKGEIYLIDSEIVTNKIQSLNLSLIDYAKISNKLTFLSPEALVQEAFRPDSEPAAIGFNQLLQYKNVTKEEAQKVALILKLIKENTFILKTGDYGNTNALALSADGKYLALAVDNDIKIWDNQIQQLLNLD